MVNILGIKLGRYTLYELCRPVQSCNQDFDSRVRLVTTFDQLKVNTLGIVRESMDKLLQHGADLFVYFEDDTPLGMMWGHRGNCYIRGPGIPLFQDNDSVYWFWIFTLPVARGKNVYKKLRNAFFAHYNSVNRFTALVEPSNEIMIGEMSKMGFVEAKRYYFVKFGNNSLLYEKCNKTLKQDLHLEMGNRHNLLLI